MGSTSRRSSKPARKSARGRRGRSPASPIREFLERMPLKSPLLAGYYGGGNFGDELLLETIICKLRARGVRDITIPYQRPQIYRQHHEYQEYHVIDATSPRAMLKGMLRSKEIIVGGGGLWSKEYSPRMTLLSATLLLMRMLGKKVYLIGVGFYDSAGAQARFGAWLAAKASGRIIVRDEESERNFSQYSSRVQTDKDIAYLCEESIPEENIPDGNIPDRTSAGPLGNLGDKKTLLIVYRRFAKSPSWQRKYEQLIRETVSKNPQMPTRLVMFEAEEMDGRGLRFLEGVAKRHPQCRVVRFDYNPTALVAQLRRDRENCIIVAPQFHAKVIADITDTPFFPLAYDHKCLELLKQMGTAEYYTMDTVVAKDIQAFIARTIDGQSG